MHRTKLTPKKVALAIGVSESSMKRWCDRGLIDFHTTAGGHRRISQASVIEFLRSSDHKLVRSELLGLPEGIRGEAMDLGIASKEYLAASLDNRVDDARKILFAAYLSGHKMAAIGDEIITPCFSEIGRQWQCDDLEVYRERRACELTVQLLAELKAILPAAPENSPLAVGGAPERDVYSLPTMLIDMVLQENGWRTQSLGTMLPFSTLAAAAWEQKPRLFWITVSTIQDEAQFLASYEQFQRSLSPNTFLVVGGNAITDSIRKQIQFSAYGDNLRQLETLAKTLRGVSGPAAVSNY